MKRFLFATGSALALLTATATGASASGGGKHSDPPCTINPSSASVGQSYTVTASSLPTNTALNLSVTDANGTSVGPLGSTSDGTMMLSESSSVAGTVTYQFLGAIKNNGATVYSSCSLNVSS
jgi:hypothetical protein